MKVIVWFSCGAASACAARLAVKKYNSVHVVYCDTSKDEHPDNRRFLIDVENWIGQKIIKLKSEEYSGVDEVIEKTKYIAGVHGARCTVELKKKLRHKYQDVDDIHIFGYTLEESLKVQPGKKWSRCETFERNNPELTVDWILVENQLTKADCLGLLEKRGIELPAMYLLGYRNNNCIGCVKGQSGYWNKIRKDFPEVFEKRAKQERMIGAAINKRYEKGKRITVYLDELPVDAGNYPKEQSISCGLSCGIVDAELT